MYVNEQTRSKNPPPCRRKTRWGGGAVLEKMEAGKGIRDGSWMCGPVGKGTGGHVVVMLAPGWSDLERSSGHGCVLGWCGGGLRLHGRRDGRFGGQPGLVMASGSGCGSGAHPDPSRRVVSGGPAALEGAGERRLEALCRRFGGCVRLHGWFAWIQPATALGWHNCR